MKQAFTPQSETVQRILDREKNQPVMNREIRTFETTPLAGCNVTEEDMQKIEDSARTLTNIQSMATLKQKVIDLIDREFPTNIQPEHPLTQHAHQVIVDLTRSLEWLTKVLTPVTRDYLAECYPTEWEQVRTSLRDSMCFLGLKESIYER